MRFEVYINGVLFYETHDGIDAFAYFRDWTGRGFDVRISFVRLHSCVA